VTTATASSLSPAPSPSPRGHIPSPHHSGLLFNEENSPSRCLRRVSTRGRLPSAPLEMVPLTNFPSNRYTATFRLNVQRHFRRRGPASPCPDALPAKNSVEGNRLPPLECRTSPRMAPTYRQSPAQSQAGRRQSTLRSTLRAPPPPMPRNLPMSGALRDHLFRPLRPYPGSHVHRNPDPDALSAITPPPESAPHQRIWDPGKRPHDARLVAQQWWGISAPATPV